MPLYNKPTSSKHMKAHDMFELETIQIFDKKTGAYLGIIRHWTTEAPESTQESIPDEDSNQEEEPPFNNPNQLNLF